MATRSRIILTDSNLPKIRQLSGGDRKAPILAEHIQPGRQQDPEAAIPRILLAMDRPKGSGRC